MNEEIQPSCHLAWSKWLWTFPIRFHHELQVLSFSLILFFPFIFCYVILVLLVSNSLISFISADFVFPILPNVSIFYFFSFFSSIIIFLPQTYPAHTSTWFSTNPLLLLQNLGFPTSYFQPIRAPPFSFPFMLFLILGWCFRENRLDLNFHQ